MINVPMRTAFNIGHNFRANGYDYVRLDAANPDHLALIESEPFQELTWATFPFADDMMTNLPPELAARNLTERESRTELLKMVLRDPHVHFAVAGKNMDDPANRDLAAFSVGKMFPGADPETKAAAGIAWYIGTHPDHRRSGFGRDVSDGMFQGLRDIATQQGFNMTTYFAEAAHPGRIDKERAAGDAMKPEDRFRFYESLGGRIVPVDYNIDWDFAPQFHETHDPGAPLPDRIQGFTKMADAGNLVTADDVEDPHETLYALINYPVNGRYATPEEVRDFVVAYQTETYRRHGHHPQTTRMVSEIGEWANAPGQYQDYYQKPSEILSACQALLAVKHRRGNEAGPAETVQEGLSGEMNAAVRDQQSAATVIGQADGQTPATTEDHDSASDGPV